MRVTANAYPPPRLLRRRPLRSTCHKMVPVPRKTTVLESDEGGYIPGMFSPFYQDSGRVDADAWAVLDVFGSEFDGTWYVYSSFFLHLERFGREPWADHCGIVVDA